MRSRPVPFARTLRAVEADRFAGAWMGIAVAALLIGAWIGWLLLSRVTLYETSRAARIEVASEVRPVEVQVAGRVSENHLQLGKIVQPGEVLLRIDDRALQLRLTEEKARLDGLRPQLAPLRAELETSERTIAADAALSREALAEERAKTRAVRAQARFAEGSRRRFQQLGELASGAELAEASMRAKKLRSEVEASRHRERKVEVDRTRRESEQRARIERLKREIAALESAIETQEKTLERIEHEISLCVLVVPVAGRIAEVVDVPAGASVEVGERVAMIVPDGGLHIVAEFVADSAVGRIRPGQRARMRLETFPWIEHGMISATVRSIATEPRNGTVRVELDLDPSEQPRTMRIEHGLLGSVEVAVDEVSPAALVLRIASRELGP